MHFARHLILLLVGNGVGPSVFEYKQQQVIEQLNNLLSERAPVALSALQRVGCQDGSCQKMLTAMLQAGCRWATRFLLTLSSDAV